MAKELEVRTPLDDLARLGTWLALSETGASNEKALGASAALRLYYADQLGLPATAVAELSVINGRLFMSAQLLRAMADRDGYKVHRTDSSDTSCTAVLHKDGHKLGSATFTMEDAKTAGIAQRGAWKTHPARMLWARASKNVIVDFAPGVALGIALDDEAQEYTGQIISEEEEIVGFSEEPDGGVTVHTTFVAPADVIAKNEQQVEEELRQHADLIVETDE